MGQMVSKRVPYDENDDNGMIFANQYIPVEILSHIFIHYVDMKSLLQCQLVCKRWNRLLKDYIWRKKAEIVNNCSFPKKLFWHDYYIMYKNIPFKRNLIKNHSGEEGINAHWNKNREAKWIVENPPIGTPLLPYDSSFGNVTHCFVTSYMMSYKTQVINLIEEGLPISILDNVRPKITVSEMYSCRWDCPAIYFLSVELIDENDEILDFCTIRVDIIGEKQNIWWKKTHVFDQYGKGLRKIQFVHGGSDKAYWAGYYGCKMACACVMIETPDLSYVKSLEDELFDL